LELLKAFALNIKRKNKMEKGHYGHYTGNARHSRKEEMIHDREMIYDAKTQIHNEDKKYKDTGKGSYKQDMIHERELIHDTKSQLHKADSDYKGSSPAHISYSDSFGSLSLKDPKSTGAYANFDGGAAGDISAMRQKDRAFADMNTQISEAVIDRENRKNKGKDTGGEDESIQTSIETKPMRDAKIFKGNLPDTSSTLNPYGFGGEFDLVSKSKKPSTDGANFKPLKPSTGGGRLSSFDTAWEKDYDGIRTSGMYGGSGDEAKARYIADVGGQGETKDKANARSFAQNILAKGQEYNPNTMRKYLKGYNKTD